MNLIEQIIKAGPGHTVEFIESPDNLASVSQHVVALLNSGGGYIILGVDKTGQVLGVPQAAEVVVDLQARLIENISPKAYLDLGVDPIEGREVVVVVVPAGNDAPFVTDGRVFLRRGNATVVATGNELQSILQKRVAEVERWERRISPTLTEDDFDLEEIRASIQAIRELKKAVLPKPAEDSFALLMTMGMVLRGQFTNAADICFGQNPAIRHAQVRVRCFVFQTDKGGDFIDQRTLTGPIAKIFEQAVAFIQERAPVAAKFTDEHLYRSEYVAYPLQVLREGLVNALAHRDYASFSGGVTIEVYPNRVEVWNSGRLPNGWDARKLRTPIPHFLPIPTLPITYTRGAIWSVSDAEP
ncbi:MAG: hypothetical protein EOO61_06915 [Hymenobacter sp.]|nr:MAG: hypothetical protein EOO61_06915 [Hymenobacter sp.]